MVVAARALSTAKAGLDARQEAIWGLARRRDPAWLQVLLDRLDAEYWIQGDEHAATDILDVPSDTPIEDLRTGLRELLAP